MTDKPTPGSAASEPLQPPWGCKCGNWTDQETCEACGRTLDRTDQEAQHG